MRSFFRNLLIFSLAFIPIFLAYLFFFPNDFFLPKKDFIYNPDYVFEHTPFRLTIYDKSKTSKEILELIANPDLYLTSSKSLIKNNEKRTIARVNINSKSILIKRFNYKNLYDWITKCPFRSSKAYRSWYYASLLKKEEIETIQPIAIIEKRIGPFWTYSYLITEYVEGETLFSNYLNAQPNSMRKISEKMTHILDVFYRLKWVHRDFIGQNILVTQKGVAVIDLDEMHSYAFNNSVFKKKFFKKHLAKLLRNVPLSSNFSETFLMTHNSLSNYNFSAIRSDEEIFNFEEGHISNP